MICPVCKEAMIVMEHHRIELDYCAKCHGVWFDSGELELLLEPFNHENPHQPVHDILHLEPARSSEKKHKCPLCGQKMGKALVGDEPKIVIDVCQREEGIWFDGGELGQLVKGLAGGTPEETAPEREIIAFVREAFQASK